MRSTLALVLTFMSLQAWAAELDTDDKDSWRARVRLSYADKERVPGLELTDDVAPIRVDRKGGETYLFGTLSGRFEREGWNLLYEKNWVLKEGEGGRFEIEFPVEDQNSSLLLKAFDSNGNYLEQKVEVEFDGWQSFQHQIEERKKREEEKRQQEEEERLKAELEKKTAAKRAEIEAERSAARAKQLDEMKRFYFTPALGSSYISYTESYENPLSAIFVTPQLAMQYVVLPPWLTLQVSGFVTAVSFGSTRSDVSARFLGFDGNVGFSVPLGRSGMRLHTLAGWYYKTMIVSPATLGFQNLMGPTVYAMVDYRFRSGHSLGIFGKLSPAMSDTGFNPLNNREIVAGVMWSHQLTPRLTLPIQFEYSMIDLYLSSKNLQQRSFALTVGLSL